MAILNFQIQTIGQSGNLPAIIYINTNNTIAEITTAGYLNPLVAQGNALTEQMIALVGTKTAPNDIDSEVNWYRVNIAAGVYSLVATSAAGSVTLPTIANHLAIYTNTGGVLSEDAATAINGGNIQAGLSGTAGYLSSFPATGSKGSLRLTAVANTGDTLVTVSNALHGQASVYTIPDVGAATGGLLVSTTPLRTKIVAGAAAAGGAAAQSFTDAFCTSASTVIGNWNTQANAVSVLKIVPGNGSFVVTSSGDAGVGTFNYMIAKA